MRQVSKKAVWPSACPIHLRLGSRLWGWLFSHRMRALARPVWTHEYIAANNGFENWRSMIRFRLFQFRLLVENITPILTTNRESRGTDAILQRRTKR